MHKIKISAVSYSNTLPFIYGLEHSDIFSQIDLKLDIPSDCADKLLNEEVDIGLVPVAVIPKLKEHYVISDYCIGAKGKVNSVLLLSDVPLNEITEIHLDYQSRTSVDLLQILAKEYWGISPLFKKAKKGFEDNIEGTVAGLIIGDRTFNLKKEYNYQLDLAEEWFNYTGLPFVFACWVSNKQLPVEFIENFNQALSKGVNQIKKGAETWNSKKISKEKLYDYLTNDIDYLLDKDKLKAIQLFHKKSLEILFIKPRS